MSASVPPVLQGGAPQGQVVYRRKASLDELMTPRRRHIPTFYTGHPDPENTIVMNGEDVLLAESDREPFTVAEIPVERRWAVCQYDRSTGELVPSDRLMDQQDFRHLYEKWRIEFYDLVAEQSGNRDVSYEGNISADPVPNVKNYVMVQVDPMDEEKEQPMHYRNDTQGAVAKVMVDSKGENPRSRDEVLLETYRTQPEKLTPKEMAYIEESLVKADDPMRQLSALNAKLLRGEIKVGEFQVEAAKIAKASEVPVVGDEAPVEGETKA